MAPAVVNTQSINGHEPERAKPHTGEIKVQDLRVPTRSVETYADGELGSKRDIIIFSGMNWGFSVGAAWFPIPRFFSEILKKRADG